MKYGDGASFSGNNVAVNIDPATGTALHFRGSRVRSTVQRDRFAKGLASATDRVVSGCSAGSLTTFLHAGGAGDVRRTRWCPQTRPS